MPKYWMQPTPLELAHVDQLTSKHHISAIRRYAFGYVLYGELLEDCLVFQPESLQ